MKRQDDFAVGLVVIAAIVGVTALALFLSHAQLGRHREALLARLHDVGGARVGSPVVIRGVESGRITAITLDEQDGWVRVQIRLAKGVTPPRDPVLILNEASMFGQWQATLEERSAAPTNLEVQQQLDDPGARRGGAIPGATLPNLGQLAVVAGRIAGDVEQVAQRFNVAFSDTAARELRATIRNVNALSTALRGTVTDQSRNLDQVAAQLKTALTSINVAATAMERTAQRVDSSTAQGQVKELVTNVRAASEDLRAMAAQLRQSASSLTRTASSFESMVGHTDSVMVKIDRGEGTLGLLVNNPSLYRNGDSLLVLLRALVTDLQAHPSRYVNVKVF
jgi:phospholipid/cholesterol/gamma-HCH transport system substrate-binding protein